ncbi:MAG: hypothetical protein WA459_24400 [Stellaceae bacterium]
MKKDLFTGFTDSEIVQYFRDSALERAKCGFNWRAGNRILDNKLAPAYQELAARGPGSARKLLQLTTDKDPHVRLEASVLAYEIDPVLCRSTLQELMRKLHPVGVQALIMLLHHDPDFSKEFERLAKLGHEKLHEDLARQFGGYLED